jgi:hypothetical protein
MKRVIYMDIPTKPKKLRLWKKRQSDSHTNKKQSEETRRKRSISMKRWHREVGFSIQTRNKISENNLKRDISKIYTKKVRQKMSRIKKEQIRINGHSWLGKHHTQKTKNKLRDINTGRVQSKLEKMHRSKSLKRYYMSHEGYWVGKNFSKAHLDKLSSAQMGRKHPEDVKKKIGRKHRGKVLSEKTRKLISIGRVGKYGGENNPQWKGGLSLEPYGVDFNYQFKQLVRERENFCCLLCKYKTKKPALDVHHIDYNKRNNIEINCVGICHSCHTLTGNNRQMWTSIFIGLMIEKYGYTY